MQCTISLIASGLVADRKLFGFFGHGGGAFEFVPVEGFAVDGSFDRFEEDDREQLAVGEALNPDMEEKPAVAFAGRMFAFEGKGESRGCKVDYEEGGKEGEEFVKAVGGGGFGVEVF